MKLKYTKLLLIFLAISSCASKKDVLLLQDIDYNSEIENNYKNYLIKVDDILKIDISSSNSELDVEFNKLSSFNSQTREVLLYDGYLVNSNGFISLPSLGQVEVQNKSISQVSQLIYDKIVSEDLLKNPSVDVKVLNTHFTILGEVNNPGRYVFLKNNLNILEAIGIGSDLTIQADRKNIKLIREIDNKKTFYNIDLTSSKFFNSESFQISSGDIIIVNPNRNRVKNAGIIGNSGTLLSLLSFILSSIIVISR